MADTTNCACDGESRCEAHSVPVNICNLANFILGYEAVTGEDFAKAGLAMLGGCLQCGSSIACYNAYPAKDGYWRCGDCIGDFGFDTVEAAHLGVFGKPRPTDAQHAEDRLEVEFVKVAAASSGVFNAYDHVMVCHGCGTFHAVQSAFISVPMAIGFNFADGSQLTVPAYRCHSCPREAIRDAWEKGLTREAYNKAAEHIGANLQPEPIACRLCGALDRPIRLAADGAHHLCAARAERGLPTPPLGVVLR